ncbi:hypothetical protein ABK040_006316 [Willaertia magna]
MAEMSEVRIERKKTVKNFNSNNKAKNLNLKLEQSSNSKIATIRRANGNSQPFHVSQYFSKEQVEYIYFDWISTTSYFKYIEEM